MEDIEIQVWEKDDKTERWEELVEGWYSYWLYEPLNSCIFKELSDENKSKLANLFKDMMSYDDTPCVVAWDKIKTQVAGFVFCATELAKSTKKSMFDFEKYAFDEETLKKMKVLSSLMEDIFLKADIFNKYKVDSLWTIQATNVFPAYTRRGLANQMTARVLELAKAKGIALVISESTSTFTQRSKIKNFQFEKILEYDFESHYSLYSEMSESMKESHKSVAVLVKRL